MPPQVTRMANWHRIDAAQRTTKRTLLDPPGVGRNNSGRTKGPSGAERLRDSRRLCQSSPSNGTSPDSTTDPGTLFGAQTEPPPNHCVLRVDRVRVSAHEDREGTSLVLIARVLSVIYRPYPCKKPKATDRHQGNLMAVRIAAQQVWSVINRHCPAWFYLSSCSPP